MFLATLIIKNIVDNGIPKEDALELNHIHFHEEEESTDPSKED